MNSFQSALLRLSSDVSWDTVAYDLNCLRTSAFSSRVARLFRARIRLPLYVTLINRGWADAQALCSTCQFIGGHWVPTEYVNPNGMTVLILRRLLVHVYLRALVVGSHLNVLPSLSNRTFLFSLKYIFIIYILALIWVCSLGALP
jgi:hypothetical protein